MSELPTTTQSIVDELVADGHWQEAQELTESAREFVAEARPCIALIAKTIINWEEN